MALKCLPSEKVFPFAQYFVYTACAFTCVLTIFAYWQVRVGAQSKMFLSILTMIFIYNLAIVSWTVSNPYFQIQTCLSADQRNHSTYN